MPSLTSFINFLYVIDTISFVPTTSFAVRTNSFPCSKVTFSCSKLPRRISGPLVSRRTATGRFSSSLIFFTRLIVSKCSSVVPCEKLILATFIPSNISCFKTLSSFVAGPNVQIIFVFLILALFSVSYHIRISPTKHYFSDTFCSVSSG